MDKQNVLYPYHGILLRNKNAWNFFYTWNNIDDP